MSNLKIKNFLPKKGETLRLWVYKKKDDKLILININEPTFLSKEAASKKLQISPKTIRKYLDTNKPYKNLFFYSKKL